MIFLEQQDTITFLTSHCSLLCKWNVFQTPEKDSSTHLDPEGIHSMLKLTKQSARRGKWSFKQPVRTECVGLQIERRAVGSGANSVGCSYANRVVLERLYWKGSSGHSSYCCEVADEQAKTIRVLISKTWETAEDRKFTGTCCLL